MSGRPRKYGKEKTVLLSLRIPASAFERLGASSTERRAAATGAILFELEFSKRLDQDDMRGLRIIAANQGMSFEANRAEILTDLIKLALAWSGGWKK